MGALPKHEKLLRAFGRRIGVDPLLFNDSGEVRIVFDDRAVDMRYDGERDMVVLAAVIATIVAADGGRAFANILELNLAHALTGNGSVGFDRDENKLYYVNYIPTGGLDDDAFCHFVFAALATIDAWARAVNSRAFFEGSLPFDRGSPVADPSALCRV